MPSGPLQTARTAAVFVTMLKTTSLASATSRGLSAQRAPASSSQSALSRVRFQTTTVWPASSNRLATPPPITPNPTKPTSATPRPRLAGTAQVALDALDVLVHAGAGGVRPTVAHVVEDQLVHLDRALRAPRNVVDARERALKKAADRMHQVRGDPISARLGHRHVEAQIGVDERSLRRQTLLHRVEGLSHLVEVPALPTRCRQRSALALEDPAHLEQLGNVGLLGFEKEIERLVQGVREPRDGECAHAVALDQAARLQDSQGFADGRSSDPKRRHELALRRQEVAGLQDARADLLGQAVGDELVRLPPRD